MYCDQCGAQNREQAKFCKKCGAKILKSETNNTSDLSTNETIKSASNAEYPKTQYQNTNSLSRNKAIEQSPLCSIGDSISKKEDIESGKAKIEKLTLWQMIKSLNKSDGRITRSASWNIIVTYIAILICFYIIYYILQSKGSWSDTIETLYLLVAIPTIAYIWVTTFITLLVQRLHDIGFSGWFWWLIIPPLSYNLKRWSSIFFTIHEYHFSLKEEDIKNLQETLENNQIIIGIYLIIILVIFFIPGNEEPNDYGSTRK